MLVRLRYLFGGGERVESQTGLTYAEYARQGFFELVAAAALVLRCCSSPTGRGARTVAAGKWVLRAFAVLLTELRVYATGFMLWLAAIFVWTGATVLRGRGDLFAFGALVAGFAAIVIVNVVNPDALIARTNVDRSHSCAEIDFRYLGGLSDDAVPVLLEALPELDPDVRSRLAENLLARRSHDDWCTWNWSRRRADILLDEKRLALVAMR